jgi:hypothetical protein
MKRGIMRVTSVLKSTLGYGLKIRENEDPELTEPAEKGRDHSAVEHSVSV